MTAVACATQEDGPSELVAEGVAAASAAAGELQGRRHWEVRARHAMREGFLNGRTVFGGAVTAGRGRQWGGGCSCGGAGAGRTLSVLVRARGVPLCPLSVPGGGRALDVPHRGRAPAAGAITARWAGVFTGFPRGNSCDWVFDYVARVLVTIIKEDTRGGAQRPRWCSGGMRARCASATRARMGTPPPTWTHPRRARRPR
eukprot:COSAG01_NODE_340_length_18638_cov_56.516505_12_plen_200_part_00